MTFNYILMCDYHLQDVVGKKHSAIGMFAAILAASFPATHQRMNVLVSISPEVVDRGQKRNIKLLLIDDDGKQMLNLEFDVELNEETPVDAMPDLTIPFQIDGMTFERPGSYRFEVRVNEVCVGESRFKVVQLNQAAPSA